MWAVLAKGGGQGEKSRAHWSLASCLSSSPLDEPLSDHGRAALHRAENRSAHSQALCLVLRADRWFWTSNSLSRPARLPAISLAICCASRPIWRSNPPMLM